MLAKTVADELKVDVDDTVTVEVMRTRGTERDLATVDMQVGGSWKLATRIARNSRTRT